MENIKATKNTPTYIVYLDGAKRAMSGDIVWCMRFVADAIEFYEKQGNKTTCKIIEENSGAVILLLNND